MSLGWIIPRQEGCSCGWGPADLHEDKDPTKNLEREHDDKRSANPSPRTGTRLNQTRCPAPGSQMRSGAGRVHPPGSTRRPTGCPVVPRVVVQGPIGQHSCSYRRHAEEDRAQHVGQADQPGPPMQQVMALAACDGMPCDPTGDEEQRRSEHVGMPDVLVGGGGRSESQCQRADGHHVEEQRSDELNGGGHVVGVARSRRRDRRIIAVRHRTAAAVVKHTAPSAKTIPMTTALSSSIAMTAPTANSVDPTPNPSAIARRYLASGTNPR